MKKILLLLSTIVSIIDLRSQVFTQTTLISGLTYPVAFAATATQRFFVTLKGHNASMSNCDSSIIKVFDSQGNFIRNFFTLDGDSNLCGGEAGILGICADADFMINHYLYFYYNHAYNGDTAIRVVRLRDSSDFAVESTIILDIPASLFQQQHVGGNIRTSGLHPGKLFVSIGDLVNNTYPQDLTQPFGKILRVNTDGTIPADNPFYDDGNPLTGNDDRIFSYGHRNPFDLCINELNGKIYSSENGYYTWDEVNLIEAGKNYGWPTCEGSYQYNSSTIPCSTPGLTDPLHNWASPLPALTGIVFYTSPQISSLTNHLLVADNNFGRVYDCAMNAGYDTIVTRTLLADLTSGGGLTTLAQGPDGCICAMKGGYTTAGTIYKLCAPGIGMEEIFSEKNISMFPNPFSAELHIKSDREIIAVLYDFCGRKIFSSKEFSANATISAENLEAGIYFLTCSDKNGACVTKRIVKAKK